MKPALFAKVIRDGVVEAEHYGVAMAVKGEDTVQAVGEFEGEVYFRSTMKPFQTLALLDSGAYEKFGLDERHLAIASGSLDCNEAQIEIINDMLSRGGFTEDDLRCPTDWPMSKQSRQAAVKRGDSKRRVYHNCAAKHAGMLLASLAYGAPPERYLEPDHPVQQHIAESLKVILTKVRKASGGDCEHWHYGGDGCGAPCLAATMYEIAVAFSLANQPSSDMPSELKESLVRIFNAMAKHPELVGGEERRIDTEIMRVSEGNLAAKVGAEALLCVVRLSDGLSIAIKSADGFDRGRDPAAIAWLKMLGMLPQDTGDKLTTFEHNIVLSRGENPVGKIEYCGETFTYQS